MSIKFELQNIVASQASSHVQLKQSINVSAEIDTPTAVKSSPCIFPGKHHDSHQPNFLQQDFKNALESFVAINDESVVKVGNRKVLYFGEYSYKYSNTEHRPSPLPDVIQKVVDKIHLDFPSSEKINSCLITKYTDGSSTCPPHSNDEPFISPASDIFTISMGAERTMKFSNCSKHACVVCT